MHSNLATHNQYRPEIDGLRGIAILSVLIFHLNNFILPGGFTGVDVFFVISGFLITSIIVRDLTQDKFSFSNFYIRRVRRIFPALFAMLLVSFIIGFLTLTIIEFATFANSLRYASAQISNFFFMKKLNYFDISSENNLLLHTWSLSVEEQFYVIYPILLFAIFKLRKYKNLPLYFLAILTIVSFGVSEYLVNASPKVAFFSLPSRFWELAMGGLVAISDKKFSKKISEIIGAIGISLLFISLFIADKNHFPGFGALMPVIGTCLVIIACQNNQIVTYKILTTKFLLFIGLISYSLYLWHWLFIAAFKGYMEQSELSLATSISIATISVIISFFSWKYIENPFRKTKSLSQEKFILLPLFKLTKIKLYYPFLILLAVALLFEITASDIRSDFKKGTAKWSNLRMTKDAKHNESKKILNNLTNKNCIDGDFYNDYCQPNSSKKFAKKEFAKKEFDVLLIGDSHGEHYANAVQAWSNKHNLSFFMMAHGGCPPLFGVGKTNDDGRCDRLDKEVDKILETHKSIKYVFIASRWEIYASNKNNLMFDKQGKTLSLEDSRKMFEDEFEAMIKKLSTMNKYIIILTQTPKMNGGAEKYNDKIYLPITKLISPYSASKRYNSIEKKQYLEMIKYNNEAISKISAKYKKTAIFYPENYLCDLEFCYSTKDGTVLYYDSDHLNLDGGLYLGEFLDAYIPKSWLEKI